MVKMGESVSIPINRLSDGKIWLLIGSVLDQRVVLMADEMSKVHDCIDPDGHGQAHSIGASKSVKCRAKTYDISPRILKT